MFFSAAPPPASGSCVISPGPLPCPILLHSVQGSHLEPHELMSLLCLKPFRAAPPFLGINSNLLTGPEACLILHHPPSPCSPTSPFQFFIMLCSLPTFGSLFLEASLPDPFSVILIKLVSQLTTCEACQHSRIGKPSPGPQMWVLLYMAYD